MADVPASTTSGLSLPTASPTPTAPSSSVQTSIINNVDLQKLRQKLKPFYDQKLKSKHRLHALHQFMLVAPYQETVRVLRENDSLVMTLWVELWLRQLDKLDVARNKNEKLGWQAKEVVEILNLLNLLRWMLLVCQEKIQHAGWQQTTIGSAISLLLAYEQHPKWRAEGLKLCLMWLMARKTCPGDLMDLLRNSLILTPFSADVLVPSQSAHHRRLTSTNVMMSQLSQQASSSDMDPIHPVNQNGPVAFGRPFGHAARIILPPNQPATEDEARQLVQECVNMIVLVASRDPSVFLRDETEQKEITDERHQQALEILIDTVVEAWWKPMFPAAQLMLSSPVSPEHQTPASSAILSYECRKCPVALLAPWISFVQHITTKMDVLLLELLFPRYTVFIKEMMDQAINSESVEIAHGCLYILRVWMWCSSKMKSILQSFVPLLLKDTQSPEISPKIIDTDDNPDGNRPIDIDVVERYFIRQLSKIFISVSKRGMNQDQFVMYLDSISIIKGLILRDNPTLTWHVIMQTLLEIHKIMVLNAPDIMIQSDLAVWANELRISLLESMAAAWFHSQIRDQYWGDLCDAWSKNFNNTLCAFSVKWMKLVSERLASAACGVTTVTFGSNPPALHPRNDSLNDTSSNPPPRRRHLSIVNGDTPSPTGDRPRSRPGRLTSSRQVLDLASKTSSPFTPLPPGSPWVSPEVLLEDNAPSASILSASFNASYISDIQKSIANLDKNWSVKTPEHIDWLWHQWLVVLGNGNRIKDSRLQHEWILTIIEVYDFLHQVRKAQPWKPSFIIDLYRTLPWILEACDLPANYAEGRNLAFGCLCRMLCRKPFDRYDEPNFPHGAILRAYRLIMKGLYILDDVHVATAILSNSAEIWTLNLPHSSCMIPAYIYICKRLLASRDNYIIYPQSPLGDNGSGKPANVSMNVSVSVRQKAVYNLCSIVCWVKWMHIHRDPIRFMKAWQTQEFYEKREGLKMDITQIPWLQIRDDIHELLLALIVEEKLRPTLSDIHATLLSALSVMAYYELKTRKESFDQSLVDSSISYIVDHFHSSQQADRIQTAIQCLNIFKMDNAPDHYIIRAIIDKFVGAITDHFYFHENTNTNNFARTEIVCALLHGLLEWLLIMPSEWLNDTAFLQQIFDVIEQAIEEDEEDDIKNGDSTDDQSKKSASNNTSAESLPRLIDQHADSKIKETAKYVMYQFLQHFYSFPLASGPSKTSSSRTNPELEEPAKQHPTFHFSFEKDRFVSFVSLPENPCEGLVVSRDGTGKYAWRFRSLDETHDLPISDRFMFRDHDCQPVDIDLPHDEQLKQDPLAILLEDLSFKYPEWLPPHSNSWNQPPALQIDSDANDTMQKKIADEIRFLSPELLPKKCLRDHMTHAAESGSCEQQSWKFARRFMLETGWWKRENSEFSFGYNPTTGFWRDLKGLDKQWSRECMKCAILYVGRGQEEENVIIANDRLNTSYSYQQFVSSLGWEIDVETHVGFLGGLEKNGTAGRTATYLSGPLIEMIWHDATRIKDESGTTSDNHAVDEFKYQKSDMMPQITVSDADKTLQASSQNLTEPTLDPFKSSDGLQSADSTTTQLANAMTKDKIEDFKEAKRKQDIVRKKRHVGNDNVHVIWDEHDRWINEKRMKTDFGNVQLIVRPLNLPKEDGSPQEMYVFVQRREDMQTLYAPILPFLLLPASILPGIVKLVSIHSNRGLQMQMAQTQLGSNRDSRAEVFEKRREGIALLVKRYGQVAAPLSWINLPKCL